MWPLAGMGRTKSGVPGYPACISIKSMCLSVSSSWSLVSNRHPILKTGTAQLETTMLVCVE